MLISTTCRMSVGLKRISDSVTVTPMRDKIIAKINDFLLKKWLFVIKLTEIKGFCCLAPPIIADLIG